MSEPIHFIKSEEIFTKAKNFFELEQKRISQLCPQVIIEHVGSSAIPNAITLGDLDIQVRVTKDDFKAVENALKSLYHINRPELWTSEFALFHWKDHPDIPMSIILTVIDSRFDDFFKSRDYLIQNPEALRAYNTLKRKYEGCLYEEYRLAKKAFFGPNGDNQLLKN